MSILAETLVSVLLPEKSANNKWWIIKTWVQLDLEESASEVEEVGEAEAERDWEEEIVDLVEEEEVEDNKERCMRAG